MGLNDYDDGDLANDDSDDEDEEGEGDESSSSLDRKSIWLPSHNFIWWFIFFCGLMTVDIMSLK